MSSSSGALSASSKTKRGLLRWFSLLLVSLLALGLTFWAGTVIGRQQSIPDQTEALPVFATVSEQTIGRECTLSVTGLRDTTAVASNLLPGVLTSMSDDGEFSVGAQVYAVDGTPVRVVEGNEPFYRDLHSGLSGADVEQLNHALVALGYLTESYAEFDANTEWAVQQWQRDSGRPITGMIARGELLAVKILPTALLLNREEVNVGSVLSGGEELVLSASAVPEFFMVVNEAQRQNIPEDAKVSVKFDSQTWPAVISEFRDDPSASTTQLFLTAPDGGVLCGDQCDALPQQPKITLFAAVELVPKTTGSAVPIAALQFQPNGEVQVLVVNSLSGTEVLARSVKVLASQDGLAVVDGVAAGERVQLFGDAALSTPGSPVSPQQSGDGAQSDGGGE